MQAITTIGLDIAKSVFQVHGHRRGRQRAHPPSVEAPLRPGVLFKSCHRAWLGSRSHYWSRELKGLGHNVRFMPPAFVKPYVKRQKKDAADAEAICEAVTSGTVGVGFGRRPFYSPTRRGKYPTARKGVY